MYIFIDVYIIYIVYNHGQIAVVAYLLCSRRIRTLSLSRAYAAVINARDDDGRRGYYDDGDEADDALS